MQEFFKSKKAIILSLKTKLINNNINAIRKEYINYDEQRSKKTVRSRNVTTV